MAPLIEAALAVQGVKVNAIESTIEYSFTNSNLCLEALWIASPITGEGNTKLAQAGDDAVKLALAVSGFENGQISEITSARALNCHLGNKGFEIELQEHMIREISSGDISTETMATTVAALSGAVFLDSDKNLSILLRVTDILGLSPET
ncbi:hypothetical protein PAAG_12268 [Paracoccidioides lutzii Pb01]|uniref:RNase III domain-containing protein n=1 Tax=Paracoccidioides lutzii (strain ATCC MYA-826 / Pb01) TaxID=502779 RepID=A0A0A2VJL3_PARBA|nr:hypothetical protein PAAG_12268 [Paracoccidioides lutzii Pb01]KGQ01074.1 hypothetical protein PAAG_12268 [Paracoccidioides lutzii Pb01]